MLNHTGIQQHYGKVLINLALPMISRPHNASPGELLRYYREKNGISKMDMAKKLGVTEYGVINLEKGFNPIYYKYAVLIGELFGINPDEFLDEYTKFCKPGFGKKIKIVREAFGVSQKDFAPILGVNRSTVSIWEAEINDHHPSREAYLVLKDMAKSKGVDIS